MGSTYGVNVECENCDFTGVIQIARGWKVSNARCPVCSCLSLIKSAIGPHGGTAINRKLGFYATNSPEALAEEVKEDIELCP